jgi:hypothetical protein
MLLQRGFVVVECIHRHLLALADCPTGKSPIRLSSPVDKNIPVHF